MSKILEGIKNLGPEQVINDVGRDDLPAFYKELGFKVGAEIGVYRGTYTKKFLDVGLEMYAVDPWMAYEDYSGQNIERIQPREYRIASETLKPYPNVHIIRKTSMEAVKDFENESLDFCYIDAHHGLKFVIEDIYEWSKKVRKGGIISGHDFVRSTTKVGPYVCHVKDALRVYTRCYLIKDWYVLGRENFPTDPNEKRDRWRSWCFFKV